jgi:outer membrane receptor protein involved in Fe transport
MTAKVRATVGHATRPPLPGAIAGVRAPQYSIPFYGVFDLVLANPDLLPEQQQGWEGGMELYLGRNISLMVTRYNQTVDDLILGACCIDSVRSLKTLSALGVNPANYPQWTDGYAYQTQGMNLNLGSIRNQGWEFQGTVQTGPLSTRMTYSNTKSRILGITPKYRSRIYPRYVVGSSFNGIAEHTWALVETYAWGGTSLSLDASGVGAVWGGSKRGYEFGSSTLRLWATQALRMSVQNDFNDYTHPYAMANMDLHQRLSSHIDGIVQVSNLVNTSRTDGILAQSVGRNVTLGVRIRL